MFEIEVTNNRASTKRGELLTKGQVGAQVQFTFNDHWTNMKKIAVFKRCGKTIDVMDSEWNGDIVTVPPEMTEEAGLLVHVGVYGVSEDGKRVIPTLYAPLGAVALGADPNGDPNTDPTLPVWAQLQAHIGDLSNLTTEDKTSLVAAINEAAKSGGGIESITYKGEDESGGNMYTVLLTDGTSYDITAPKGAKGDKGNTGEAGAPGKAATIQVGEVTTGAAGTPASVSNVGTDEAAIFDFTIPRGEKGADGADGADGITPHIGDNGNWYLGMTDTGKPSRGEAGLQGPVGPVGPQGPAGADGKDGAGMDITGAAVGQIAKIAAVDASGVPTAWSPEDMPSGGSSEDMRVIKTITITADGVNSIYFNRDDNGLPFALTKHIRIRMYGAATNTGSTQATLFFRAGQTSGDVSQNFYPIKVNSNNSNYIFDFVWDLYSAINCWYGDYASARAGTIGLYRYVPSESNNSADITVREIKLVWSNASVFFQQGATIAVEGM